MFFGLVLNTWRAIIRQKISFPLVFAAAIVTPFVSYFMFDADRTLIGVLKMMYGWQFYASSVILMLLAAYLAATILDSETRGLQLVLTLVKPASRTTVLFAKFVALATLLAAFTALCGISAYVALRWRASLDSVIAIRQSNPETTRFTESERRDDAIAQQQIAATEFFISRRLVYPVMPNVAQEIRDWLDRVKQGDYLTAEQMPSDAEIREFTEQILRNRAFPLPYKAAHVFNFRRLPRGDAPLTFRFTINGTQRGDWGWLQAYWQFSGSDSAPYARNIAFRRNTPQSFEIPGQLIGADGNLTAVLYNLSAPTAEFSQAAQMSVPFDGLSLLLPRGAFAENFARAWLMLWLRLSLLAAIGVGFSPLIAAPVNALVLITALFAGALNSGIHEMYVGGNSPQTLIDSLKYYGAMTAALLPNFAETDTFAQIAGGLEISWRELLQQAGRDLLLRGGIILAIGALVFHRREIATLRD